MESLLWELRGSIFSIHCISDKQPSSCWTPNNCPLLFNTRVTQTKKLVMTAVEVTYGVVDHWSACLDWISCVQISCVWLQLHTGRDTVASRSTTVSTVASQRYRASTSFDTRWGTIRKRSLSCVTYVAEVSSISGPSRTTSTVSEYLLMECLIQE